MMGRMLSKDIILERGNFFLTLKKGTKIWKLKSREYFYGRGLLGIYGKGDFLYKFSIRLPMGRYSKEITRDFEGAAILIPPSLAWDKILEASEEISEDLPSELADLVERIECDFKGRPDLAFFTQEFSLLSRGEDEIMSFSDLNVVKKGESKAVIHSGEMNLVINREKVIAKVEGKNYVISGEKVIGPGIVVSGPKVITSGFVGKSEEMAREIIGDSLKEIDKALKKRGFVQESS